jgi:outer membrane protein TolC
MSSTQLNIGDVLGNGINIWNIGINLLQPLFRGGELQARKRAAEAGYEQALAAYRLTVLQALQNVADVLRALEADAQAVSARSLQADRAEEAYEITLGRFRMGAVSEVVLIEADRQRLSARVERMQAVANQYANAAALFPALGGSWK